jgi:hypothetical protein
LEPLNPVSRTRASPPQPFARASGGPYEADLTPYGTYVQLYRRPVTYGCLDGEDWAQRSVPVWER